MSETLTVIYLLGLFVSFALTGLTFHMLDLLDGEGDIGIAVPAVLVAALWPISIPFAVVVYVRRQREKRP